MAKDRPIVRNRRWFGIVAGAAALLSITVVLGITLGFLTRAQFAEVEDSWIDYAGVAEQKGILISEIRGRLGYGGIIHNFKNYVLRQDDAYREATESELLEFHQLVSAYRSLPLDAGEAEALNSLVDTVQQYEQMLRVAVEAAQRGERPQDTDRLVRIDDRDALVALVRLESNWRAVQEQSGARIATAVKSGRNLIWIGFFSIFALVVAASVIGALVFLLVRGLRDGVADLATELDERKRLERSENRLATAVEQSPATILITDTNARIQYANSKFEDLSGWTLPEIVGKTPSFLQSGNTDPDTYQRIRSNLEAGQPWQGTFRNQRKDGSSYWADTMILPLLDQDGVVRNFIGIGEDITEKRQAREQVVRAQKLEAVGQLAGGVAHDFNNILTTIVGSSHLAALDAPEGSELAGEIEQIAIAARRAKSIVNELLTFARREPGESRPVNLVAIVEEVTGLLKASLPPTVTIEIDCPKAYMVVGDPTHLHQIIMNLCRNAAEAMAGERGTIRVSVASTGKGRAVLEVADNGPGMTEDIRKHLFEPFFTTKPLGKGSGLGLAVVFGLVDEMNGTIIVESEPGEGAVFRIELPETQQSAEELEAVAQALPRGNERVILIDDEAEVAGTLRRILTRLGYQVQAFTGPKLALERFRKGPGDFDLVVSDMVMPDLNGEELANEFRKIRPRIPVLFCSAYKPENLEISGPSPVILAKPVEPLALAGAARQLLDDACTFSSS
ncbi:MAG: ATP-binding protein [Paracoccaceae bacterium]